MLRVTKTRILALSGILATIAAYGQLRPDTSIEGFQLPLFDEAGNRAWQLWGDLVTYKSETQISITGMQVTQFTGDFKNNREVAKLTSPHAVFHFDSTSAYGPGELHVETNAFEVTGHEWVWLGEKRQITLNKDVKVVLYEEIGDILK
ncbi:hypothetical protein [Pelagicoccus mobilis]|uniref:LPS export ABC transporter periplasmic protein LptC n=1 Tax=Pelagicoccus mobilis TaxID=415221 RepID=A0A934RVG0_9BACT|nr:hypothetical protein [Pelagicoccus mobilis]MBK1875551.1 hypothetical protein [Pelagicoccus mobilis]